MLTPILAAGAPAGQPNFGFFEALQQGGAIAYSTLGILVIMSVGSFYILFTKLVEQQKIMNQAKRVRAQFWQSNVPRCWPSACFICGRCPQPSAWR